MLYTISNKQIMVYIWSKPKLEIKIQTLNLEGVKIPKEAASDSQSLYRFVA